MLLTVLDKGINAPLTSSMGRLFDTVAALICLRQRCSFEGQAAIGPRICATWDKTDECYPFEITSVTTVKEGYERMIEWKLMIMALLEDKDAAVKRWFVLFGQYEGYSYFHERMRGTDDTEK